MTAQTPVERGSRQKIPLKTVKPAVGIKNCCEADIDRPYSSGINTVGAVYDRATSVRKSFETETPLKTVKAVGWHQELLQGRQIRRHDVRQALTSEFGVSSPSRGGRCKRVSLPFVLFAKLGRRRQFVVPLNVRIKLVPHVLPTPRIMKMATQHRQRLSFDAAGGDSR